MVITAARYTFITVSSVKPCYNNSTIEQEYGHHSGTVYLHHGLKCQALVIITAQ